MRFIGMRNLTRRSCVIMLLGSLLGSLFATGLGAQEGEPSLEGESLVTRIYDVRAILRERRSRLPYALGAMRDEGGVRHGGIYEEGYPSLLATTLVELLKMATARGALSESKLWEEEGAKMDVTGSGLLVVSAPVSTQAAVWEALRKIEGLVVDDFRIECHFVPLAATQDLPLIASAEAADRMLRDVGPHPVIIDSLSIGFASRWSGSREMHADLAGMSAVCKPSMAVIAPMVVDFASGRSFTACLNPGLQGGFVLSTWTWQVLGKSGVPFPDVGRSGGATKTAASGLTLASEIERVAHLSQVCAFRLGEAVICGVSGLEEMAVVVLLRPRSPGPVDGVRLLEGGEGRLGLRLFPVFELTAKMNRDIVASMGLDGMVWREQIEADKPPVFDDVAIADLIKNTVAPDKFADASYEVTILQELAMIAVLADEPSLSKVEGLLADLGKLAERQFEVDLRCGVLSHGVALGGLAPQWETMLKTRVRGIARLHRGMHATAVNSVPYIQAYKVMAEDDAMAATPVMQSVSSGIDVIVEVLPTNGSKVQLLVDMNVSVRRA